MGNGAGRIGAVLAPILDSTDAWLCGHGRELESSANVNTQSLNCSVIVAAIIKGGMLPPESDDLRRQFEQIRDDAAQLVEGLSEAQFNWRPSPSEWSVCECVGHLNVIGEAQLGGIDEALANTPGGMVGHVPANRHSMVERCLIWLTEPPARLKVRAPRRFRPSHGHPPGAILPRFLELQRQLIARLERAKDLDLRHVKVRTPISRLLRLSLGAALEQIAAHERRHLRQARNVRQHPHFPAG